MLSDAQLKLVSEMLSNIGLVFFGSLVVPIFAQAQVSVGLRHFTGDDAEGVAPCP